MKNLLLTLVLSLGLASTANATSETVVMGEGMGGFSALSTASQIVGVAAVGLVALYAIQSNKFDCVITKTDPLPGTNYTNEKSTCVEK